LPSIIKIGKSRKLRWSGHVARTGNKVSAYAVFMGKFSWNTFAWMIENEMKSNNRMDWEISCGDGKCMELAKYSVEGRLLLFAVL
jgi:hypothetical protein